MLHDYALTEPSARPRSSGPMPITARTVRAIIAARWLRREYLGFDASDPEWSLMLELYAASLEGRRVHQTGLSVAAGVPQTTALNVTRRLIEAGVFDSRPDKLDGRRLLIGLTPSGADRIQAYLKAAAEVAPPIA